MTCCGGFAPTTAAGAGPRNGCATGPIERPACIATGSRRSTPPTCGSPASMGPPPTTWRGPSTTPATPFAMIGPIPTCRPLPTTSARKTPASEPAAICTARTNGSAGLARLADGCGLGVLRQGGARSLQRGPARPRGRPRRAWRRAGPRRRGDDPCARAPRPGGRRAGPILVPPRPALPPVSRPEAKKEREPPPAIAAGLTCRRRCRPG